MTKKMIVLNASPRKNKNTAALLEEAMRRAEAASADAGCSGAILLGENEKMVIDD